MSDPELKKCHKCQAAFYLNDQLMAHIATVHPKPKPESYTTGESRLRGDD